MAHKKRICFFAEGPSAHLRKIFQNRIAVYLKDFRILFKSLQRDSDPEEYLSVKFIIDAAQREIKIYDNYQTYNLEESRDVIRKLDIMKNRVFEEIKKTLADFYGGN